MALGHTVIFQGWNDGNPGNRDKPAARVLGGSQPGAFGQCFSPAFLTGPCTAGSVKLKVCFQRSGLKAGYTSANIFCLRLFPSAPHWHRTFFCLLNDTEGKYGFPCHYLEELERCCWGNTMFLN